MENSSENDARELAKRYGAMADGELLKLSESADELTDTAKVALDAELARRNLDASPGETESVPDPRTAGAPPVIVARFVGLNEALLAKGQLDAAGIASTLIDDNMVRMDWFYSNAVGGVKLAVQAKDEADARAVLDSPIPENFEVEGVGDYEQPRCPKCNSAEITFESLDKPLAYGSMWMGVPIPFGANHWHCEACGAKWEEVPDEPAKNG